MGLLQQLAASVQATCQSQLPKEDRLKARSLLREQLLAAAPKDLCADLVAQLASRPTKVGLCFARPCSA